MITFKFDDLQRLLGREHRLIRTYRIYVSGKCARSGDPWILAREAEQMTVRVYRRIAGSG